jgi:uncharacterized membrane protein
MIDVEVFGSSRVVEGMLMFAFFVGAGGWSIQRKRTTDQTIAVVSVSIF